MSSRRWEENKVFVEKDGMKMKTLTFCIKKVEIFIRKTQKSARRNKKVCYNINRLSAGEANGAVQSCFPAEEKF